jgi:hypothetical protein
MHPEKLLSEQKRKDQEFTQRNELLDTSTVKTISNVIEAKADNSLVNNACDWDNWHSESAF